ncbi:MAG: hypothetical protein ABIU29_04540, partial [Chthoniobacterales bacterium]
EHFASALYLEWFSALSGRVVIESTDYRLEISEPGLRFSADELSFHHRPLLNIMLPATMGRKKRST